MKKTLSILTASFLACVFMAASFTGFNRRPNIFNEDVEYNYAYSSIYSSDTSASSEQSSEISSNSSSEDSSTTSKKPTGSSTNNPYNKPIDNIYKPEDPGLPPPIFDDDPGTVSDIESGINSEVPSTPSSTPESKPDEKPEILTMKAVWISYFDVMANTNYKNSTSFTAYIQKQIQIIKNKGLNTVFYQVRPYGDACYPSKYYPSSVGLYGASMGFDALKIVVEECHKAGIQCHAWVNPYRTMTATQFNAAQNCKTKTWFNSSSRDSYMIAITEGTTQRYWLKPGNKEVQTLIKDGVEEILKNYNVDGIHIDDYFYAGAISAYGDTKTEAQSNTTAMVKSLYNITHSTRSNAVFGVSPMGGFTANKLGLPDSDRSNHSTNLKLWCQNSGYIDYVMPQIYWAYDNSYSPFTPVFNRWENFVDTSKVKLYVGLSSHTVPSCIPQQIKDIENSNKASGYALFSMRYI